MKHCPCGAPGEYFIGPVTRCHECLPQWIRRESREETYRLLMAKGVTPITTEALREKFVGKRNK